MKSFIEGSANAAGFMLCTIFVAYVTAIVVPLLRHRRGTPGDGSNFDWHFLIPCLNEERVITATVNDLFKKFPSAHIWCIDDGSTDSTFHIVSRMASRSGQVHVVTRRLPDAHDGKGPALNAGWKALVEHLPPDAPRDRIIVGVMDADGVLDPKCLNVISGPTYFADPEVSAVQVMVRVRTHARASARTRLLTQMQDIEFSCVMAGMQMLRRHVGSTAMGGNGQFTRLSALQEVAEHFGTPWERALVEDFELGLRILLTGGQTQYCHDTSVIQQGPSTVSRLMRQRSRWAQGLMQCFRYFMPIMRSPNISTPAALEIGVLLLLPWFQLFGVVVYLIFITVVAFAAFGSSGGPLHWLGAGNWGLVPLFVLFGLVPLALWGPIYRRTIAQDVTRRRALLLGLIHWPYTYTHHIATWWALGRLLSSRNDWKKTERVATGGQPKTIRIQVPAPAPASVRPARPARRPATIRAGAVGAPFAARAGAGAGERLNRPTSAPEVADTPPPVPAAARSEPPSRRRMQPVAVVHARDADPSPPAADTEPSLIAVGKLRAGGSTRRTRAAARSERVPLPARGYRRAPVVGGRLKVGPPLVPAVVRSGSDSSGPVDRTTIPE